MYELIWILFSHVSQGKRINDASIFNFVASLLLEKSMRSGSSCQYMFLIITNIFKIKKTYLICIAIVLNSK